MIGHLIFRLAIWLLLTASFSWVNIMIGVGVALLLPRRYTEPAALRDWLQVLWQIILAVPKAYFEAFEMMIHPHTQEDVVLECVLPRRSPQLIFLDVFLITFTPKTIVLRFHNGCYEVHRLRPQISARSKP